AWAAGSMAGPCAWLIVVKVAKKPTVRNKVRYRAINAPHSIHRTTGALLFTGSRGAQQVDTVTICNTRYARAKSNQTSIGAVVASDGGGYRSPPGSSPPGYSSKGAFASGCG